MWRGIAETGAYGLTFFLTVLVSGAMHADAIANAMASFGVRATELPLSPKDCSQRSPLEYR
jgi:hypothetical protein